MPDMKTIVERITDHAEGKSNEALAAMISKRMIEVETLIGIARLRACEAAMAAPENPSQAGYAFLDLGGVLYDLKSLHQELSAIQSRYLGLPIILDEDR